MSEVNISHNKKPERASNTDEESSRTDTTVCLDDVFPSREKSQRM